MGILLSYPAPDLRTEVFTTASQLTGSSRPFSAQARLQQDLYLRIDGAQ